MKNKSTPMKIFFFLFLTLVYLGVNAQTKVKFGYDNSGNRTSRTIELPAPSSLKSAKVDSTKNEFKQMFEDKFDNTQITIYPNPTKGVLKIDIAGFENKGTSVIYVYNTKGNMVTQKSPLSESNIIDLSPYPGGMYVLKIVLGNDVSEWKILKE